MLFRSRLTACALAVVFSVAGCSDTPTSPSSSAPFSQTDLRLGTGTEAVNGTILTVHYTGWLYDPAAPDGKGLVFEASTANSPFTFALGFGFVVAGWDQGLVGMKAGGLRRLVVPPSLGYGARRKGAIPPYATMVFEIELLEVETE